MLKLHAFLHWVNILINTAWLTFNPLEIYEKLLKTFWSIRCNIPSRQILVPSTSPKHPIWPSRRRPHLTSWSDVPKTPWSDVPGTSRSDVPGTSRSDVPRASLGEPSEDVLGTLRGHLPLVSKPYFTFLPKNWIVNSAVISDLVFLHWKKICH